MTEKDLSIMQDLSRVSDCMDNTLNAIDACYHNGKREVVNFLKEYYTCENSEVDGTLFFGFELPDTIHLNFSGRNGFITALWLDVRDNVILQTEEGDEFILDYIDFKDFNHLLKELHNIIVSKNIKNE